MVDICVISIKDITLRIIYNKLEYALSDKFSSDKELAEYIRTYPEEAFARSIKKVSDKVYVLNIASSENFGYFEWDDGWSKNLINSMLATFEQIIQRFISDSVTNTL